MRACQLRLSILLLIYVTFLIVWHLSAPLPSNENPLARGLDYLIYRARQLLDQYIGWCLLLLKTYLQHARVYIP